CYPRKLNSRVVGAGIHQPYTQPGNVFEHHPKTGVDFAIPGRRVAQASALGERFLAAVAAPQTSALRPHFIPLRLGWVLWWYHHRHLADVSDDLPLLGPLKI